MGTARDDGAGDGSEALATAETAPGLGLVPGHKRQLRERVEARLSELTRTLLRLDGDVAFAERVRAIDVALRALDAYVGGGWDNVGAVEAASLARWLESTELLVTEAAAGG